MSLFGLAIRVPWGWAFSAGRLLVGEGSVHGPGSSQSPLLLSVKAATSLPLHHWYFSSRPMPAALPLLGALWDSARGLSECVLSSLASGLDHHLLVVLGLHGAGDMAAALLGLLLRLSSGAGLWPSSGTQLHWVPSKPLASSARLCPCWPGRPFLPDTTVSSVRLSHGADRDHFWDHPPAPGPVRVSVTTLSIHHPQYSLCNEPLIELSNSRASGSLGSTRHQRRRSSSSRR